MWFFPDPTWVLWRCSWTLLKLLELSNVSFDFVCKMSAFPELLVYVDNYCTLTNLIYLAKLQCSVVIIIGCLRHFSLSVDIIVNHATASSIMVIIITEADCVDCKCVFSLSFKCPTNVCLSFYTVHLGVLTLVRMVPRFVRFYHSRLPIRFLSILCNRCCPLWTTCMTIRQQIT